MAWKECALNLETKMDKKILKESKKYSDKEIMNCNFTSRDKQTSHLNNKKENKQYIKANDSID